MESVDTNDQRINHTYWEKLKDKQQMDIFSNQHTHDGSVLYSVPWSNPSIYSSSKATVISKKYDLPMIFKQLVDEEGNIRLVMSTRTKYILMATKTKVAISIQYKEKNSQDLKKLELILPIPPQAEPPFIDLILPPFPTTIKPTILESNAHAGIVMVAKTGHLRYWPNIKDNAIDNTTTFKSYQLSLGFKEEVTCTSTNISTGSSYQLLIGTSIGNVYLVRFIDSKGQVLISDTSLYQNTISSTMLGSFWSYMSSSSAGNEDSDTGGIIKIVEGHTKDQILVLSKLYIQNWTLSSTNKATLISKINILSVIQEQAIPLLLPEDLTPNMKVDLLDIDRYGRSEWAILVSYSIPEMGDFAQFALVCMKQLLNDQHCDKPFQFLQSYSLPYSIIPSKLHRRPSLQLSNGSIAYVSFDNTVISIAVTPNSLFEHALVLRQENKIIGTIVKDNEDTTWATGLVFTTGSGVLEYKINQSTITESRSEGNVYAIDYEDEKNRDIALVRSKLEQAIFFGYNDQNPLYFPVRLERRFMIGKMVASLAKDIITGASDLVPKTLDTCVSLEQRLKFTRRIPDILKNEDLLDLVDTKLWIDLWSMLESCYMGIEFLDLINQQKMKNDELVNCIDRCLENAFKTVSDQIVTGTVNRHNILSHQILSLPRLLENMTADSMNFGEYVSDNHHQRVNDIACFILQILSRVEPKERSFALEYVMTNKSGDISEFLRVSDIAWILRKHFMNVKACIETIGEWGTGTFVKLTSTLVKYGDLLLTIYQSNAQMDSCLNDQYRQETQFIIGTLWDMGRKDATINLATTHRHYPILVTYAHEQPSIQCQKLVDQYIQSYGDDFVRSLLQFYSDTDNEDRLLRFNPAYDDILSEVLRQNPNIGWKYHMQKGNYKDVYKSLLILMPTIKNIYARKTLLSQAKLAYLTANTMDMDNTLISTVLESDEMKQFTVELELVEAQERLLSKFRDILAGHTPESKTDQVDLILKRTSSQLLENEYTAELGTMKLLMGRLLLDDALSCNEYVMLLSLMDNNGANIGNYLLALYFARIFSNNENREQTKSNLNCIWKSIYTKDDWRFIDQCVKRRNNTHLSNILNQTTLYRVLLMCKKQGVVDELILRPGDVQLYGISEKDKILDQNIQSHRLETYFDESICAISLSSP